MKRILFAVAVLLVTSCGSGSEQGLRTQNPITYLLRLNQLDSPGFVIDQKAQSQTTEQIAASTSASINDLQANSIQAAAAVHFFRSVSSLATANGPVDIASIVEQFPSSASASKAMNAEVARRESDTNQTPTSTGPLGDEASGDVSIAHTANTEKTPVVQITLEWRVGNLVNLLVVRGRYGGTHIDDALKLAHRVTDNEQA